MAMVGTDVNGAIGRDDEMKRVGRGWVRGCEMSHSPKEGGKEGRWRCWPDFIADRAKDRR